MSARYRHFDTRCAQHGALGPADALVGNHEIDVIQSAQQQTRLGAEFGTVDQRDQRIRARHQFALGLNQNAVGLQQSPLADGGGADEHFAGVKVIEAVVIEGAENDVLLGKYAAAGHGQLDAGARQQGADDVQGVGQYLQIAGLQVRAHLKRGGAAIDDHRVTRRAQRCRDTADRHFLRQLAPQIRLEGHALQVRAGGAGRPRPTVHALQLATLLQPLQIAAHRGGRRVEFVTQGLQSDEILLAQQFENSLIAFGGMHGREFDRADGAVAVRRADWVYLTVSEIDCE